MPLALEKKGFSIGVFQPPFTCDPVPGENCQGDPFPEPVDFVFRQERLGFFGSVNLRFVWLGLGR